jgi:hypothetical protein
MTPTGSKWARKRKIDLADLVDASWISTPSDVVGRPLLTEAFQARAKCAFENVVRSFRPP